VVNTRGGPIYSVHDWPTEKGFAARRMPIFGLRNRHQVQSGWAIKSRPIKAHWLCHVSTTCHDCPTTHPIPSGKQGASSHLSFAMFPHIQLPVVKTTIKLNRFNCCFAMSTTFVVLAVTGECRSPLTPSATASVDHTVAVCSGSQAMLAFFQLPSILSPVSYKPH
jgi:hypothetical protein